MLGSISNNKKFNLIELDKIIATLKDLDGNMWNNLYSNLKLQYSTDNNTGYYVINKIIDYLWICDEDGYADYEQGKNKILTYIQSNKDACRMGEACVHYLAADIEEFVKNSSVAETYNF